MRRILVLCLAAAIIGLTFCSCENTDNNRQTESGPDAVEYKINDDIFSDIGLTYSQIEAKRGKLINVYTARGGIFYEFENGYGSYPWELTALQMECDESGKIIVEIAPKPKQDEKCISIDKIDFEKMFLGSTLPIAVTDFETRYNVKGTMESADGFEGWDYVYTIIYHDKKIAIYTNDKNNITSDNYMNITAKTIRLEQCFNNLELPINITDFEKQYNLKCTVQETDGYPGWKYLISVEDNNRTLSILTNNKDKIENEHYVITFKSKN